MTPITPSPAQIAPITIAGVLSTFLTGMFGEYVQSVMPEIKNQDNTPLKITPPNTQLLYGKTVGYRGILFFLILLQVRRF